MKILLLILFIYISIEILILIFFPKWLRANQFDEGGVVKKDKDLGWRQKPNITFKYHHRYNKFTRSICRFNNYGILDNRNYYKKKKKKIRVAIFGDTYYAGYDYGYNSSFQKILRSEINRRHTNVEILFCSQINYNTFQLFKFYKKYFKNFNIDYVIYIFNSNHPRRNITIHEAKKSKKITYPYYNLNNLKKIKNLKITDENDLAYIDSKNKIINKKQKTNIFYLISNFFYDNFYFYSFISDTIIGKNKLRNLKDISEIKTIEKTDKVNLKNYPHRWEVTKKILFEWKKYLIRKKTNFYMVRNLNNYQYDLNLTDHKLSFLENNLPETQYLKDISKKININYIEYSKKELQKGFYYIHPRYGYFNKQGINYISKLLTKNILKIILK